MKNTSTLPINVFRNNVPSPTLHPFTAYFRGFENVGAVRAVFGEKTETVLRKLKVGFISNRRMYMGIRDKDGNLGVGAYHLKHSDRRTLYLDIVHELFHVKQFLDDRKYFREEHQKFMLDRSLYYSSPIEVPAYFHTVKEAKRIGMSYKEIVDYLKIGPVPPKVFANFLRAMELEKVSKTKEGKNDLSKLGVKIIKKPSIDLHSFNKYFKGFEKVPSVRALFGVRTEQVLSKLLVEFTDFPFRSIFPSDYGDGDIVVSLDYFKQGDINSLYLDIFLCLNMLKRLGKRLAPNSDYSDFGNTPKIFESYKSMIREARHRGISEQEILKHLALPRFLMSSKAYHKFLKKLGLSLEV
jgi:hypothetical protein